jgi:hypothetical protein
VLGEARGGGSGDSRCPREQNDGGARFALEDFDLLPHPTAAFQPRPNDGLGNAKHDETAMKQPRAKTRNLRESCVLEAMAIIGETGIEELSLREVARRLGVSDQAPYKHRCLVRLVDHARAGDHPTNERNSDAGAAFSRSRGNDIPHSAADRLRSEHCSDLTLTTKERAL